MADTHLPGVAPIGDVPRSRRRGGRGLRITLIILVVLAALFVAADRLALHFAESEVADKIKSSQGLSSTPDVSVKGFPFVTQVVGKELDEVDISLDGLTTSTTDGQAVRVTELNAQLHQVRISGDFSSAVAERATGSAHISYADLSAAAGAGIKIGYAHPGTSGQPRVKITGSLLGLSLSMQSTISVVDGDTIQLHAEEIPAGGDVPGWESQVRQRTDIQRKINGLPMGLRLNKLETTSDGIDISVQGHDVELTQ